MKSVTTANDYCLVVKVFPRHDLEVTTSTGLILHFWIMLKCFQKMYIMTPDIVGKKRIGLTYSIQGKEEAVVSMFSDSIQYEFMKPWMVELGELWSKQIMAGTYTR